MATAPEITAAWTEMCAWLRDHRPDLFNDLRPGADAESLAKLTALGVPEEWCALWAANDGGGCVLFDGWTWVPIQGVVDSVIAERDALLEMAEQLDADTPPSTDGPVQAVWAHPDWIPFAVDVSGCLLCIDLAPLDGGARGQVILVQEDHRRVLYDGPGSLFADCLIRMEMGVHPDEEPDHETDEWAGQGALQAQPAAPAAPVSAGGESEAAAPIPPPPPSQPAEVIQEPTVRAVAEQADEVAQATIQLDADERADGCTVFIRQLTGDVVGVRVPAGAFDGARLRIPGLGGRSLDLVLVVGAAGA